jgi:hypothetical protein
LVETDLDDDGDSEFILVQELTYRTNLHMFYFEEGEWLKSFMVFSGTDTKFDPKFFDALRNEPITTHLPRWNDVQIGGKKFRVSEK